MARQKTKNCLYCYSPFRGRRDAKTCSNRCRKGLQRARVLLERDLELRLGDKLLDHELIGRYGNDDTGPARDSLIRGMAQ